MARRLAGLRSFLRRFSHCRRGNVAMMFALALPLLTMTSLVGVDVHRISTVRANLQDALDAAALAAARSPHMDQANITAVGLAKQHRIGLGPCARSRTTVECQLSIHK